MTRQVVADTVAHGSADVGRAPIIIMHSGLYVVMGVCGSGTSLIGALLARALGIGFVEGDAYHSPENVARMSAGIPLTDEDRQAWLAAIATRLDDARRAGLGLVVSCSALKRSYRDVLRAGRVDVQFVYLEGTSRPPRATTRRASRTFYALISARQPVRYSRTAISRRGRRVSDIGDRRDQTRANNADRVSKFCRGTSL